jgi:hypothetical protein
MDFGIAKMETGMPEASRDGKKQLFGTIEYMPPEQASSNVVSDERADIYSIGAVLYQMLTGRKHFNSSRNILQDIKRLRRHEPISPRFYNREISDDMEAIVRKALKNVSEERYRSARELSQDLQRYQESEPVTAQRPSLGYTVRKRIVKNKIAFIQICFFFALIAGFAGYIVLEKGKQWGDWKPVFHADFIAGVTDMTCFAFKDGANRNAVPPFDTGPLGLKLRPFQWCWITKARHEELYGDIRVVVTLVHRSSPRGLRLSINTRNEGMNSRYEVPSGHSVHHGAFCGTMDILSRNRKGKEGAMYHSAAYSAEKNRTTRIVFEKTDDRYTYYLNGRKALVMRDLLPDRGPDFSKIGFISYSDSIYIQSLEVFRLSIPQKPSPLIAGDVLRAEGKMQEAMEKFLTISRDNAATEVAEKALLKAYMTVSDDAAELGHFIDSVKKIFQEQYPNSAWRTRMLEVEILLEWERGNYRAALDNLASVYAMDPGTDIVTRLPFVVLSPDERQAFLTESGLRPEDISRFNLVHLDMSGAGAESIAPLKDMPLQWLWLSGNRVADLEPLRNMPLRCLTAGNNRISDLSPLVGMRLERLYLNGNDIVHISPLQGMPVHTLNLAHNAIEDIMPLTGLPLRELDISFNAVADLSPLQGSELTVLAADSNRIASLEPLWNVPLTSISIQNNQVKDFKPLRNMPLRCASIGNNHATSIEPLTGKNFLYLNLDNSQIEDYSVLNRISVTSLVLSRNHLRNIKPLYSPDMKSLVLDSNDLTSVQALINLKLEKLSFSHNRVRRLLPLRAMDLNMLNCQDNNLETLAPFLENPPDTFLFDNASLPASEIQRALRNWRGKPGRSYNARYAGQVLNIRSRNIFALKKMARKFAGHWYLHITRRMTWHAAAKLCRDVKGHLVTVQSLKENRFLYSILQDNHPCWTGLKSFNGKWEWITGEPAEYYFTHHQYEADLHNTLLFTSRDYDGKWVAPDGILETGFIIEWDE